MCPFMCHVHAGVFLPAYFMCISNTSLRLWIYQIVKFSLIPKVCTLDRCNDRSPCTNGNQSVCGKTSHISMLRMWQSDIHRKSSEGY